MRVSVCTRDGAFIFRVLRVICQICSLWRGNAWLWTGGAPRGLVSFGPVLLFSKACGGVSGGFPKQPPRKALGTTLAVLAGLAIVFLCPSGCYPAPHQCSQPPLLNVQRTTKTVPLTNVVYLTSEQQAGRRAGMSLTSLRRKLCANNR